MGCTRPSISHRQISYLWACCKDSVEKLDQITLASILEWNLDKDYTLLYYYLVQLDTVND